MKKFKFILLFLSIMIISNILILSTTQGFNPFWGFKDKIKKGSGIEETVTKGLLKSEEFFPVITYPKKDSVVSIPVNIIGKISEKIHYIELKLDNGKWHKITQKPDWSITFNTMSIGVHTVYVHAVVENIKGQDISRTFYMFPKPTEVSASDGTYTNKIRITWNPSSGAEKYYIYRSTSANGIYSAIGNTIPPTTTYDDTNVSRGRKYYYKVKAYSSSADYTSSAGYSEFSDYDGGFFKLQSSMIPEMVFITNVTSFSMGGPSGEGGENYERPVHPVDLKAFYISKYEITIQQYVYFLNSGWQDSHYHIEMADTGLCGIIKNGLGNYSNVASRSNYPVVFVSWNDARAYCNWLTENTTNTYRLPTEAEWEYVAVGNGPHKTYPWGSGWLDGYCNWADGGSVDGYLGIAPVGKYLNFTPPFWVYDMSGNVWEWCQDWYDESYYDISPVNNPTGPASGTKKVLRGGSWFDGTGGDGTGANTRCAYRGNESPTFYDFDGDGHIGFRPVRTLVP